MEETNVALSENDQRSVKEKLKADSKTIIDNIQDLMEQLKQSYYDDSKFNELLRTIHGRFSKIELNLNDLEKLKNVDV